MIVTNTFNENLSEESKQNWLSYWNHFNNNEYQFCAEHNCINKHHHGALLLNSVVRHGSPKLFSY